MAWWDAFAGEQQYKQSGAYGNSAYSFRPTNYQSGYSYRLPRGNYANYGAGATNPAAPITSVAPPPLPDRLQFAFPFSTQAPGVQAPPRSTQGDLLGSIGAALGQGNFNLGNIIPHIQELPSAFLHKLQADNPNSLVGDFAGAAAVPFDSFLNTAKAVSDVVEPVLNAFPNWVRDSSLGDRAKVYAAIAHGTQAPNDFFQSGDLFGSFITLSRLALGNAGPDIGAQIVNPSYGILANADSARGLASKYNDYLNTMGHALDPAQRLDASTKIAMIKHTLDLPESVKFALDANPQADVNALLDAAPEGRSWSYNQGATSIIRNMATPLLFYLAEWKAGAGLLGGVKAFGEASGIGGIPTGLGALSGVPKIGAVAGRLGTVGGVGRAGLSTASSLIRASLKVGGGTYALIAANQAVARYQGNQAAIDWWDNATKTTPYSDDPRVQLVTSFAANPFDVVPAGFKSAGRVAAMPFVRGADIVLGRSLGDRYIHVVASGDLVNRTLARMYKLQPGETTPFLDRWYPNPADRSTEVLRLAADYVVNPIKPGGASAYGVTSDTRLGLIAAFPDAIERTQQILKRYPSQIVNALKAHSDELAAHFYAHSWEYMNTGTPFHPDIAAQIALEHSAGDQFSFNLRQQTGTVLGYREHIPPDGTNAIRSRITAMTDAAGNVPIQHAASMSGDSWDALVRDYPALRKMWQGVIKGERTLPASALDAIAARAEADWNAVAKQNPVRAATGVDPVLRSDSATPVQDYADALGTSTDTYRAITNSATDNASLDLMRTYLTERNLPVPSAPADILAAAYTDTAARALPWENAGKAQMDAEGSLAKVRTALNALDERRPYLPSGGRGDLPADIQLHHDLLMQEQEGLNQLLRIAGDPIRPFAERAGYIAYGARRVSAAATRRALTYDEALAEAARQKVLAQTALGQLSDLNATMTDTATAALSRTSQTAVGDWTNLLYRPPGGDFVWGGNASPIAASIVAKLERAGVSTRDVLSQDGLPGLHAELKRAVDHGTVKLTKGEATLYRGYNAGVTVEELGGNVEVVMHDLLGGMAQRDSILSTAATGDLGKLAAKAAKSVPAEYLAMARTELSGLYLDPEMLARVHPANISTWQHALDTNAPLEALTSGAETDPIITGQLAALAEQRGQTLTELVRDETAHDAIRAAIVPADFVAPVPGVLRSLGSLDDRLIGASDPAVRSELVAMQEQLLTAREEPAAAIPNVTPTEAAAVAERWATERLSMVYRKRLGTLGADLTAAPDEAIMAAAENAIGMRAINILNHGPAFMDHNPASIYGLLAVQRTIEDGSATRMGMGVDVQAEAQRVIRSLLDDAVRTTKKNLADAGTFTTGASLAGFGDEQALLASTLFAKHPDAIIIDENLPPELGIRYGLKRPPSDALVMEWSQVPGLAEEFLTKQFAPFEERAGQAWLRQHYNYVFGPARNLALGAETRARYVANLARQGVGTEEANVVWQAWQDAARTSPSIFGFRTYGSVRNIPGHAMNTLAQKALIEHFGRNIYAPSYKTFAQALDYSASFREASSFLRGHLARGFDVAGHQVNVPLGQALASMYGAVAHNAWVTTWYYVARFGLDIRFHAQDFIEADVLAAGRAGLKPGLREAHLGQTQEMLTRFSDPISDTGYNYMRNRQAVAYRTFLREQDPALVAKLRGISADDPALMQNALVEMARSDPELATTIKGMGDTPGSWLRAMDTHYRKLLGSRSDEEAAALFHEDFAAAMAAEPHMAELYSALSQEGQNVWADLRKMFMGNPDRSRAERVLNHYLLFWPISYQIKVTKWLTDVLFKSVGGLPTNAAGAYALNGMIALHNRQLATDPAYRDMIEKHKELLFLASMLLPISPDNVGVSLSPGLASMFNNRTRAWWKIGPIFTLTDILPKVAGELYPDMKGVPGLDGLYRAMAGMHPGQKTITVGPKLDEQSALRGQN